MVKLVNSLFDLFTLELKQSLRKPVQALTPVLFGFLVVMLFPVGLGPAPELLAKLAPGLVWVIILLACLLATDQMFREDYDDGFLTLWLLSPRSSYFVVLIKVLVHWLRSGFVVAVLAPVFGLMLNLPSSAMLALLLAALAGSLALVFIGAIGAALTVSLRHSSALLTLIVLPLYLPVLILGVATVDAAAQDMSFSSYLALLSALSVAALSLSPLAIYSGLRVNLDAR